MVVALVVIIAIVFIAIPVIINTNLFVLSVFDDEKFIGNKASGFSGFTMKGWKMDTAGTFTMKVNNQVGKAINVKEIKVTVGQTTIPINGQVLNLAAGADSDTLTAKTGAFGSQKLDSGYTANVIINYADCAQALNGRV